MTVLRNRLPELFKRVDAAGEAPRGEARRGAGPTAARPGGCTPPRGDGAGRHEGRAPPPCSGRPHTGSGGGRRSPRGGLIGRGRVAGEDDPLAGPLDRGVGDGNGAHQGARVGVPGPVDHVLGGPELDDLAQVHDGDPVRDVPHDREVVGDEDEGEVHLRGRAARAG